MSIGQNPSLIVSNTDEDELEGRLGLGKGNNFEREGQVVAVSNTSNRIQKYRIQMSIGQNLSLIVSNTDEDERHWHECASQWEMHAHRP
jgi:hypothetical protein